MGRFRTYGQTMISRCGRWLVILTLALASGACVQTSVVPAVNQGPTAAALRLNTLGVAYMNLQRVENALAAFERAWELDENLYPARLNQAIALFNIQRFDEAELILVEITRDRPDSVRAWYNLGLVYRNTGRSEEAAVAFSEPTWPQQRGNLHLCGIRK